MNTTPPTPGTLDVPEGPLAVGDAAHRNLLARLPRYQQIAENLRAQITSGQLAPGEPIPSETVLMERYGVSRITARNAVRALRASGLVITEHGRATYVRPTATTAALDLTGPAWGEQGWTLAEEPTRYRTTLDHHPGPALDLPQGEPVFACERLWTHPTVVRLTHRVFVPFAVCADTPGIEANPFAEPAALAQALTATGARVHFEHTTTARMPNPDEAATLTLDEGTPILIHTRRTLTTRDDGQASPVLLEEIRLNPTRTQVRFTTA